MMFVFNISVRKGDKVECDTFVRDTLITAEEVKAMTEALQADVIVSLAGTFTPADFEEQDKYCYVAHFVSPEPEEVKEDVS